MKNSKFLLLVGLAISLAACGKGGKSASLDYPGTEAGAKQLLTDIRKKDAKAMTLALRPSSADYKAVFADDATAATAEKSYGELWSDPKAVIAADPANTELLLWQATSDEIKAWGPEVQKNFPGGYEKVGSKLKSGLTFYRWKYVKPGEESGMAFDGLVFVNGHWAWFPKPWRAIGS